MKKFSEWTIEQRREWVAIFLAVEYIVVVAITKLVLGIPLPPIN